MYFQKSRGQSNPCTQGFCMAPVENPKTFCADRRAPAMRACSHHTVVVGSGSAEGQSVVHVMPEQRSPQARCVAFCSSMCVSPARACARPHGFESLRGPRRTLCEEQLFFSV